MLPMTRGELMRLLMGDFRAHFADDLAARVLEAGALGALYAFAAEPCAGLSADGRHKLSFRSAWVLERIYFGARERFEPFADRFCRVDFPACTDPGARRHFGKIMADLLPRRTPDPEVWNTVAETAAEWAVDPAAKVAVRIWAVEILKACRTRVPWVADSWDDLVGLQLNASSPGLRARWRNSWLSG